MNEQRNVPTAQYLMSSSLVTVPQFTSIEDACRLMMANRIRHLPVVDESDGIVGILSERDVLRANVSTGRPGEPLRFAAHATAADFMTTTLMTISANGDLQDAITMMLENKISSCLVESEGFIVGIITYDDLMGLLSAFLAKPSGGLRSALMSLIARSPLGEVSQLLANSGI